MGVCADISRAGPDVSRRLLPISASGLSGLNKVLELNPGESFDPIVCMLRSARLDENPSYEAISYVCGAIQTSSDTLPAAFKRLDITVNLHDVLQRLRHPEKPRMLWADAMCIYQDRYRSKCCRNLRFEPQVYEGVGFAHLACRIGKFTLGVFIMEIYQFRLHVALPVLRLNMTNHVSLL
jgi:hypothetical protein